MRTIKLMPDYQCYPLWEASPGQVGNISPDDLPISPGLRRRLAEWSRTYDDTLDPDDPARSGFPTADAETHFKKAGHELATQLRQELGQGFEVILKM